MQSRARFWRPSFWSAAVDGLWSVIVPVAWPLTDGLSRWSPSTGGGNESGLRTLLLSAPLTPCLSPRLPIWAISPRLTWWVWVCVRLRLQMCVCRWAETFCKKKKKTAKNGKINCCTALLEPRTFNSFPRLIWCFQAAESAKQSGMRIFPALHRCPSSGRDLSGSTEALTEWQSHKLWPSALHKSFGETNQITLAPRCLSVFRLRELQEGPTLGFSTYTCNKILSLSAASSLSLHTPLWSHFHQDRCVRVITLSQLWGYRNAGGWWQRVNPGAKRICWESKSSHCPSAETTNDKIRMNSWQGSRKQLLSFQFLFLAAELSWRPVRESYCKNSYLSAAKFGFWICNQSQNTASCITGSYVRKLAN